MRTLLLTLLTLIGGLIMPVMAQNIKYSYDQEYGSHWVEYGKIKVGYHSDGTLVFNCDEIDCSLSVLIAISKTKEDQLGSNGFINVPIEFVFEDGVHQKLSETTIFLDDETNSYCDAGADISLNTLRKLCSSNIKSIIIGGVSVQYTTNKATIKQMVNLLESKTGKKFLSTTTSSSSSSSSYTPSTSSSSSSSSYTPSTSSSSSSSSYTPSYSSSSSSSYSPSTSYSSSSSYPSSSYGYSNNNSNYNYSYSSGWNRAKNYSPVGMSFGYVQKQWVYKGTKGSEYEGITEKHGVFADDGEEEYVNGIQVGLRYEPQWKYGFGLNTGLYYEYYWYTSGSYYDDYGAYYSDWQEHSLYAPLHLEFRANISDKFQIFAYGGVGFDLGLYSAIDYIDDEYGDLIDTYDDIYDDPENEIGRFNASLEYGGGLRIGSLQFQFQASNGLVNMAERGNKDYTVYQNKPLTLSVSWMF